MMISAPSDERLRVLIVEDEALVSMMLVDLVEDAGFEVVGVAANAVEAFALARDHPSEIAIIDVSLRGDQNGVVVGGELSRRHAVALIFTSGHNDVQRWPEVRALRPIAVLPKPWLPDEVVKALRAAAEACSKKGAAGNSGSFPGNDASDVRRNEGEINAEND